MTFNKQSLAPNQIGFLLKDDLFKSFEFFEHALEEYGYSSLRYSAPESLPDKGLDIVVMDASFSNYFAHHKMTYPTIALFDPSSKYQDDINGLLTAGAISYAPINTYPRTLIGMLDTVLRMKDAAIPRISRLEKVLVLSDNYAVTKDATASEILLVPQKEDVFWRLQNNFVSSLYVDFIGSAKTDELCTRMNSSYPNIPVIIRTGTSYVVFDGRHDGYSSLNTLSSALDVAQKRRTEYLKKLSEENSSCMFLLGGPRAAGKSTVGQLLRVMVPSIVPLCRISQRLQVPFEFSGQEFLRGEDAIGLDSYFSYTHRKGYEVSFPQKEMDSVLNCGNDALFTVTSPVALESLANKMRQTNLQFRTILINVQSSLLQVRAQARGVKMVTMEEAQDDSANWDVKRARFDYVLLNTFQRHDASSSWGPYSASPDDVLDIEKMVVSLARALKPSFFTSL